MSGHSVVIRTLGVVAGSSVLFILGFLGFLMLTEFNPETHFSQDVKGGERHMDASRREFTFYSWNIGYAGLGREQDFFYDGGTKVIPDQKQFVGYFNGIKKQVKNSDTVDFIFLQEIDKYAKRSWYTDEVADINKALPSFSSAYATNYDCRFVPMPIDHPMGRVVSGLATYSQFKPRQKAEIQYFDAYFPWPKRLVLLKRCFILLRFELDNGRNLVIINTHNSAFDPTGTLRKKEMIFLDSLMKSEYQKGNYVVAGGDWNNNPRGFNLGSLNSGDQVFKVEPPIESGFLPGWKFVFDPVRPSNRNVNIPYTKGVTKTTIIDFFVVSPNIEVKHVATSPMGFAYSDHEPVVMSVRLK